MATVVSSCTVGASFNYTLTKTRTGNLSVPDSQSFTYSKNYTNGTAAAGTADLIYGAQGTLAGAASVTLDFSGGVTDAFGDTITMARLKHLFIHLTTDTTSTGLTVGNATNPINLFSAATATISIRNGGIFLIGDTGATGIPLGAAASDALKLLNADGTNTATYVIGAIGSSA